MCILNKRNVMKYIYLIFVWSWLCFSCQERRADITVFPVEKELSLFDSISIDDEYALDAVNDLCIVDSILVFQHGPNGNCRYSFWHCKTGKFLRKWGVIGQGKGEFLDFGADLMLNDSSLMFYSWMSQQLYSIPLPALLADDAVEARWVSDSMPHTRDFRISKLLPFDSVCVVLGSFASGERLGIIDRATGMRRTAFDYPFDCGEVDARSRTSVFQGKMKADYDSGRFVVHSLASDVFEIYQVDDTLVTRICVSPFQTPPVVKKTGNRFMIDDKKSAAGLFNMTVTNEWICFNHADGSYEDLMADFNRSDEILCFDWQGEKAMKMKLPFKVDNFCMDSAFVYSVGYRGENGFVYRFRYR